MGNKKIFDMGRDLHKVQSILDDHKLLTHEKASLPDKEDLFGFDKMPGTHPRWLYAADLVVSIISPTNDLNKGVYILKSRYGTHGQATMGQVIDIAVQLLKVEFDLNIGFFEDVVAKELREAIADVLHRHKVLPKKDWNKIVK